MRKYLFDKFVKIFADDLRKNEWIHYERDDLDIAAQTEVMKADTLKASGTYKREAVYAILQKKFPNKLHHTISFAIEKAIQKLR